MLTLRTKPSLKIGLLWLAVIGIIFINLGHGPLTDLDEGAFSEASREMLERGDWISPWLLDQPRFDKPVLIHWLQMASMSVFGITTFAARLPSALATLIWIGTIGALAYRVSKKLGQNADPKDSYFWAIIISTTSIGIPAIGRAATADALLNALLALGLFCIWQFFFEARQKKWSRAAALCLALGLLTKGPIAFLVLSVSSLFAALGVALNQTEHLSGGKFLFRATDLAKSVIAQLWRFAADPLAWLILLATSLPWYILQYQAQGEAFIQGFFGTHNIGRFVSTMHGFSSGPWYYPAWTVIAMLPWLPLLVWWVLDSNDKRLLFRCELLMFSGVFLFVMIFFSLSATKLPHYGFYGLSGLITLIALSAGQHNSPSGPDRSIRIWWPLAQKIYLALLIFGMSALPYWWGIAEALIGDAYYQTVWREADLLFKRHQIIFFFFFISCMLIFLVRNINAAILGSLIFAFGLQVIIVPTVMSALRDPIVGIAQIAKQLQAEEMITWRLMAPSLSYHAQRIIPAGSPTAGKLVALHEKDHDALFAEVAATSRENFVIETLWKSGGLQLVRIK